MNELIEWAKRVLADHDKLEADLAAARQSMVDQGYRLVDVSYSGSSSHQDPTYVWDYETKELLREYPDTDSWWEDEDYPKDWAEVEAVEDAVLSAHEWFDETAPKGFPPSIFNIDDVDYDDLREWLESVS